MERDRCKSALTSSPIVRSATRKPGDRSILLTTTSSITQIFSHFGDASTSSSAETSDLLIASSCKHTNQNFRAHSERRTFHPGFKEPTLFGACATNADVQGRIPREPWFAETPPGMRSAALASPSCASARPFCSLVSSIFNLYGQSTPDIT